MNLSLREKCPHTEFFWSVLSRIRTKYVFSPNAGKYGPEKTLYLDTFHAVTRAHFLHLLFIIIFTLKFSYFELILYLSRS